MVTSITAIAKALKTVNFDKNQAIRTGNKEDSATYRAVEKKLEEALEIMEKHKLN